MELIQFILPAKPGGVLINAINLQRVLLSRNIKSQLLLTQDIGEQAIPDEYLKDADHIFFRFSSLYNIHHTFRLFKNILSEYKHKILVLNDYLDHSLIKHIQIEGKIISIVHGDYDYYYDLAQSSQANIDHFVCVSKTIYEHVLKLLPTRSNDIFFIPPCVSDSFNYYEETDYSEIKIIYVGRMTDEKGFNLLPLIDEELKEKGLMPIWTIVAPKSSKIYDEWLSSSNVTYYPAVPNEQMARLYNSSNIILLPSWNEGFPLSIIEAMKCGVVPLLTDLPTISDELVNSQTGFRIEKNDYKSYVAHICYLHNHPEIFHRMALKASENSQYLYNEQDCYEAWMKVFNRQESGKATYQKMPLKYSRLDAKWLPNIITVNLRKLKLWMRR